MQKEQPKKRDMDSVDGQFPLNNSLPTMQSGGSRSALGMRARQREIRRRIGFEPLPITPEITTQFDNVSHVRE